MIADPGRYHNSYRPRVTKFFNSWVLGRAIARSNGVVNSTSSLGRSTRDLLSQKSAVFTVRTTVELSMTQIRNTSRLVKYVTAALLQISAVPFLSGGSSIQRECQTKSDRKILMCWPSSRPIWTNSRSSAVKKRQDSADRDVCVPIPPSFRFLRES